MERNFFSYVKQRAREAIKGKTIEGCVRGILPDKNENTARLIIELKTGQKVILALDKFGKYPLPGGGRAANFVPFERGDQISLDNIKNSQIKKWVEGSIPEFA